MHVRYLGARHRYAPKWRGRGDPSALSVVVANDASSVSITLPPGEGVISGQPLLTSAHYNNVLSQLTESGGGSRIVWVNHMMVDPSKPFVWALLMRRALWCCLAGSIHLKCRVPSQWTRFHLRLRSWSATAP